MILLANPPGTDNYLANGSTPILAPQKPVIVVIQILIYQQERLLQKELIFTASFC